MDKGQHLRLRIIEGTNPQTKKVTALATDLTFHLSATTENSTTKDTTDAASGAGWEEFDVTQRSGEIQIGALIGAAGSTDPEDSDAKVLNDFMAYTDGRNVEWDLAVVTGTNNRTLVKVICSGGGRLSSVNPSGQNRQKATYQYTLTVNGPITVAND